MEPISLAISLLGLGLNGARAAGIIQTHTDRLLLQLDKSVAVLVAAPLHEGFGRLEQAALAKDRARQRQLLDEARAKFSDVAARSTASPAVRGYAGAALAACWHGLGEEDLARRACLQALAVQHEAAHADRESARRAAAPSAVLDAAASMNLTIKAARWAYKKYEATRPPVQLHDPNLTVLLLELAEALGADPGDLDWVPDAEPPPDYAWHRAELDEQRRDLQRADGPDATAMLAEVEQVLERLDEGQYGICRDCSRDIPEARLAAFPQATLCIGCKQREERG